MLTKFLSACAALTLATHAFTAQPPAPAPSTPAAAQPADAKPIRWKGRIMTPAQPLDFVVSFTKKGLAQHATLTIAAQGLVDGELKDVDYTDTSMRFKLVLPGMPDAAHPKFDMTREAGSKDAKGKMTQHGMEFDVTMTMMGEGEGALPAKKQDPKPPFPYTARDVTFENPADHAKLAGTLTIPEGKGPHPAVVMITGSGPQDRDEFLLGHRPFLVIADHLSRQGVAVLRVDDRGIGGSTSPDAKSDTTMTFASDAEAAFEFLITQPEIDAKKTGLVGHSEGGLIAPIVASRNPKVAFIVLMAGTGVNGREVLREQIAALMKASGASPDMIAPRVEAQQKLLGQICAGASDEEIGASIRQAAIAEIGLEGKEIPEAQATMINAMVAQQQQMLTSAWMKAFLKLEPKEYLSKTTCPVLAINGSLDCQVLASQNLPEIKKALDAAGNKRVTIVELPQLNHLFQTCTTGAFEEYAALEETISPKALEEMAKWIRSTTGLAQ